METNIYQQNGYENRDDYLLSLAEEFDLPYEKVYDCADLMGESEDFDGLISILYDAKYTL